jgi:hypothetical protein
LEPFVLIITLGNSNTNITNQLKHQSIHITQSILVSLPKGAIMKTILFAALTAFTVSASAAADKPVRPQNLVPYEDGENGATIPYHQHFNHIVTRQDGYNIRLNAIDRRDVPYEDNENGATIPYRQHFNHIVTRQDGYRIRLNAINRRDKDDFCHKHPQLCIKNPTDMKRSVQSYTRCVDHPDTCGNAIDDGEAGDPALVARSVQSYGIGANHPEQLTPPKSIQTYGEPFNNVERISERSEQSYGVGANHPEQLDPPKSEQSHLYQMYGSIGHNKGAQLNRPILPRAEQSYGIGANRPILPRAEQSYGIGANRPILPRA